jgi:hypothetical protein
MDTKGLVSSHITELKKNEIFVLAVISKERIGRRAALLAWRKW